VACFVVRRGETLRVLSRLDTEVSSDRDLVDQHGRGDDVRLCRGDSNHDPCSQTCQAGGRERLRTCTEAIPPSPTNPVRRSAAGASSAHMVLTSVAAMAGQPSNRLSATLRDPVVEAFANTS
jgi:hypothetical protein